MSKQKILSLDKGALNEYLTAQTLPDVRKTVEAKLAAQGKTLAEDVVLATAPGEHGGTEILVMKTNGVVVLLRPMQPQVKNTPKGPRMVRTLAPDELPLVRRTAPKELTMAVCRAHGWRIPPGLLLFQGRHGVAAREVALQ